MDIGLKIALVFDIEYPERYPFTSLDFIKSVISDFRKLNEFNQYNLDSFIENLDEYDCVVFMANSLHNPYINSIIKKNITRILWFVKKGMGIVQLHQANPKEYIPLVSLGISVINKPFEAQDDLMFNTSHPIFQNIDHKEFLLKENHSEKIRQNPILSPYALFTGITDPNAPVTWLIAEKIKNDEDKKVRAFELEYGLGRIICLLGHLEWFEIGGELLRRIIFYVSKKHLVVDMSDGKINIPYQDFILSSINMDKGAGFSFRTIIEENIAILEVKKPLWLTKILAKRLENLLEPNELYGVPVISNSPPLTIESLFPLVIVNPNNVLYHNIFIQLVKEFVKPDSIDFDNLLLNAAMYVRLIGIYEIIKGNLSQREKDIISQIISKIYENLFEVLEKTLSIERSDFYKLLQNEVILVKHILTQIMQSNLSSQTQIFNIAENFGNIRPKTLPYQDLLKILNKEIKSARLMANAILSLNINPEFELRWLFSNPLMLSWNVIEEKVYGLEKESRIDLDEKYQTIERINNLQNQYFNSLKKIKEVKEDLESLRQARLVIKGRTFSDFKKWVSRNRKWFIGITSVVITIITTFEAFKNLFGGD